MVELLLFTGVVDVDVAGTAGLGEEDPNRNAEKMEELCCLTCYSGRLKS